MCLRRALCYQRSDNGTDGANVVFAFNCIYCAAAQTHRGNKHVGFSAPSSDSPDHVSEFCYIR